MAVIIDSGCRGVVDSIFTHAQESQDITSIQQSTVRVSFEGFEGDSHSGLTRSSCVRVKRQYKVGTTIRNTRQVSILSAEELDVIASRMGLPAIKPAWLGANLCLSGIPDFTQIPPATRLLIGDEVSLVVDVENEPCKYPADIIEKQHAGYGAQFIKNAMHVRGVTAWVECEGVITKGDMVAVHTPPQNSWNV